MMDSVKLQHLVNAKELGNPLQGLVVLDGDLGGDTLESALRKLAGHKILSAPVRLPTGGYCMIDMAAIGYALASNLDTYTQPIATIVPISEKIEVLDVESSLLDLVKTLAAKKHHRVVLSKDGAPFHVLSQMDVVRYVDKHADLLSESTRNAPIKGFMTSPVLTLHVDDRVADALKKIVADAVGGAAVVDDEGKVQANFSVSDLRGITTSRHYLGTLMDYSVEKFLKETKRFAKLPVELNESNTMADAIHELSRHHIHRVHIVDSEERPVGVVSSSDIIRCLAYAS